MIRKNKLILITVPIPQEYRIAQIFNILFKGCIAFQTTLGKVDELRKSLVKTVK